MKIRCVCKVIKDPIRKDGPVCAVGSDFRNTLGACNLLRKNRRAFVYTENDPQLFVG